MGSPPKFRDDTSVVSLRQLEELTRKGFRTVKAAVLASGIQPEREDKNAKYYSTPEALEAVYRHTLLGDLAPDEVPAGDEGESAQGGRLDPVLESAKLNQARRKKVELETEIMRGDLISAEDVQKVMDDAFTAVRAKALQLPRQCGVVLIGVKDPRDIESKVAILVEEFLQDASKISAQDVTTLAADDVDEEATE